MQVHLSTGRDVLVLDVRYEVVMQVLLLIIGSLPVRGEGVVTISCWNTQVR